MLPDINQFSDRSIVKITSKVKEVLEVKNDNGVSEITEIISNEVEFSFKDIEEMYNAKKKERLNVII